MNNMNNLGISMRNSADIQAHSISLIKDNRVVSLEDYITEIAGDGGGEVDAYTKAETDALLSGNLNVLSLQSSNNIQTATTLKSNYFENYHDDDILFSLNGVNYMEFRKDTGTVETPNNDAMIKIGVSLETTENVIAGQGFTGTVLRNNDGTQAPSFNHLGHVYMKYEDAFFNASAQGVKILDSLYTQDIIPSQIKMSYNQKISFTDSDGTTDGDYFDDNYIVMSIDNSIPKLNHVVLGGSEHRFYVGGMNPGDLIMKMDNLRVDFYRDIYFNNSILGSGGYTDSEIDTLLTGKLTIATPETLTGKLVVETTGTQMALGDTTADREIAITDGDCIDCSEKAVSNNPAELKINYNREANVRIGDTTASLSINTPKFTDKVLSVVGDSQFNGRLRLTSHLTLAPNLVLYMDEGANRRYLRARQMSGAPGFQTLDLVNENTSLGRISLTMGSTEILRVNNTEVISSRNHRFAGGIELTVLDSYYQNTDMVFRRDGFEYMKFLTTDQIQFLKLIQVFNNSINVNEIRNFATDEDINFIHEATTYLTYDYTNDNLICKSAYFTVENLIGCNSFVSRVAGQDVQFGYEGNAYLEYKHATDEIWLNKPSRINSALNFSGGSSETVIYEQMVLTSNVLYIKNTQSLQTPKIIFQVGSTEVFQIEENTTRVKNTLSVENSTIECLTYGSNTGVPSPVKFQKQGVDYMSFNTDEVEMLKPMTGTTLTLSGKVDTLEVETFSFNTDNTNANIPFAYNNSTYMYYNVIEDRFDFYRNVSAGTNNIYCNDLIETSDKRKKENIEDVDEDCVDLVKKIKVKTYNLKHDEKKKNHIGFIADELQEILPKQFEAIVDTSGELLGINYGKMTAVLTKALQETLNKVEHLEASMYEMMEEIKELKGKKPKAKAKSKEKAEK